MLEAVLRDATSPALRKTAFMSNVAASRSSRDHTRKSCADLRTLLRRVISLLSVAGNGVKIIASVGPSF
jgi:hypothetical protein